MQITINILEDHTKEIHGLISTWKELSLKPLTCFAELKKIEQDIISLLLHCIFAGDDLDHIKAKIEEMR